MVRLCRKHLPNSLFNNILYANAALFVHYYVIKGRRDVGNNWIIYCVVIDQVVAKKLTELLGVFLLGSFGGKIMKQSVILDFTLF